LLFHKFEGLNFSFLTNKKKYTFLSAAAPSQPISGLRKSSVTSLSPFAQLLKVTSSSSTPLLANSLLFEDDINNVFSVSYSISWLHICQNFIWVVFNVLVFLFRVKISYGFHMNHCVCLCLCSLCLLAYSAFSSLTLNKIRDKFHVICL